ncbi:MAG: hypothetical protein M0Z63_08280 [Actinomycetota bacterium]|jgi:hypothetical protein|nr:hypothetical protein [Actinomycetota bacterium]MDA8280397.1 hypothetical protein [Actinomycetota bacterium]
MSGRDVALQAAAAALQALADDGNWSLAARLEATAARLPAKVACGRRTGT